MSGLTAIATPATLTAVSYPGVTTANTLAVGNNNFQVSQTTTVANTIYGGRHVLSATQNLSSQSLHFSIGSDNAGQSGNSSDIPALPTTANGWMIAIFDNLGNYRRWVVGGANVESFVAARINATPQIGIVLDPSYTATMQGQSATPPDLASTVAIEFHIHAKQTGGTRWRISTVYKATKTEGIILTGAGTATMQDAITYQSGLTLNNSLNALTATQARFVASLKLNKSFNFNQTFLSFARQVGDFSGALAKNHVEGLTLNIDLPVATTGQFVGGTITSGGTYNLIKTIGAGSTLTYQDQTLSNGDTITLTTQEIVVGTKFLSWESVTIAGASITDADFVGLTANPALIISSLAPNTSFAAENLAGNVRINLIAGDYSDWSASFSAGRVFEMNGGGGAYNLTGLEGGTIGNPILFDAIDGGSYTITVGGGITAAAKDPQTNGSVTLVAPASQIILSGIPEVAGAVVGVIDLTTSTPSYPPVVGATCTIPTDPTRNYFIAVDAPGWIRQAVTLSGSADSFTLDWSGRNFRALYELGDPSYTGIDIDLDAGPTQFQAWVDDSELDLSFATVFRRVEDLLSVEAAIFFPNPPVPQIIEPGAGVSRNYLVFPYDAVAEEANPVVVRPHPDNLADPRFTDFVAIWPGAADPFYSNVLTDPATGRRIRIQTEALGVSLEVSGGLSAEDRAVINAIALDADNVAATLASSGVFSEAALVNVPSGGGGESGDITAIAGSTTAATALLNALTGTGAIRSNVVQVAGQTALASSPVDFGNLGTIAEGVPRSSSAVRQVVTAGTVINGSFATTAADDGSYFSIAPGGSGLNVYLEFDIGSQFPMGVTVNGRYNAIIMNRFCNIFAWNWLASAWEQLSDSATRMNNSNTDTNYSYPLLAKHREGTGSVGRVRIGFQSTDTLNTIRLDLDQVLLKSVSAAITAAEIAAAVYSRLVIEAYRRDHGIVVDTVNGSTGVVIGDNGIAQNPSSNLADAFAIATVMKAKQLFIAGGSSLTINQAYSGWAFLSQNGSSLWSVNLNGQVLTGSVFLAARVSGTGLSTTDRIRFEGCVFDAVTLGNAIAQASVLGATSSITAISGADISLRSCYTVNVSALPVVNFAAPAAATRIRVQDHKGSVRVQNMNANSTLWFSADGQLVIESSCEAGQIFIESTAEVVNNGFATVMRLNVLTDVQSAIAEIATDANDLAAALQSPGVFSAVALANAPGGGDGLTAQQVWEHATRSLTDKGEFTLSATGVAAIEAALIDEGDGQMLVDAILQVINANLDLPVLELTAIAQAVRTNLATELARLDAAVSSRSAFDPATATVTVGVNQDKVGYSLTTPPLDATAIQVAAAAALEAYDAAKPSDVAVTVSGGFLDGDRTTLSNLVTTIGIAGAGLTEAGGTGDQFTAVPASSTPVLANVTHVAGSPVSGVSAFHADVSGALTDYGVPTLIQVQVAGFTTDRSNALIAVESRTERLFKRQGLLDGVTATVKNAEVGTPGYLTTSDGAIAQVTTKNPDGSVTISNA